MSGSTGNSAHMRIVVVLLAIVFVVMVAVGKKCQAEETDEGISLGFGRASAGGEICFDSMLLTQSFGEDHWLGYLATHGDASQCRGEPMRANLSLGILRIAQLNKWTIGFGGAVLEHGDIAIGPDSVLGQSILQWGPRVSEGVQLAAAIIVRRRLTQHLSVDWLHNSTGGSTRFNRGLNFLVLSARF